MCVPNKNFLQLQKVSLIQLEKLKSNEDATKLTLPHITRYKGSIASFY